MKPIAVVLIALVSAVAGGIVGALVGGIAGGVAGGSGGTVLGVRAGICQAANVATAQKLLTQAQADQLKNQAYTQLRASINNPNKDLVPANTDCQEALSQLKELANK